MLQTKEEQYDSGFSKTIVRNKYDLPMNERLKEARLAKKYSLPKVIKMLDRRGVKCGLSTLQGYEASESSIYHRYPSLIMLLALADLYECSTDYLFGRSEKKCGQKINFEKRFKSKIFNRKMA